MNSFDKHLDELVQTVKTARANYDIWWVYKNADDRDKYLNTMNSYVEFFRVSIYAHFVALVIALYKLYDKRNDSIEIHGLIEEAKEIPEISSDVYEPVAVNLSLALPISEKVKLLRHKLYAHRDKELDFSEVFTRAQISGDELRELTDHTLDILNLFLYERKKSTQRFGESHSAHTYKLLNKLYKDKET